MIPIEQQRIVSLFTVILTAGKNLSVMAMQFVDYLVRCFAPLNMTMIRRRLA
jgi:hypothetical protein